MSVNLPGKQFAQNDIVAHVKNTLKKINIPPKCLELENTEVR